MADSDKMALEARLRRLADGLPGVETGTSYGAMALKVAGRLIARAKDAETVMLPMPLDEKEHAIELAPEIYFETPHYRGWAAVLVRASAIGDEELRLRLTEAWRRRAPAKLRRAARPAEPPGQ